MLSEVKEVTELNLEKRELASLARIAYFEALVALVCSWNRSFILFSYNLSIFVFLDTQNYRKIEEWNM
ncbi:hypothetical protein [Dysgonomonas sp. ZJ279]|uniref:hypothetical protein n=1 Tax=Dysgonomonas sp. ZJ279 TaxID=2709796 RepID=UPI0013EDC4C9|nr:hypothetical protein [Dysgonomonas sp. ZJ279]